MNLSCVVRVGTHNDLRAVVRLWSELNTFHHSIGLQFPEGAEAGAEWVASFERTLGRFSFLWVAELEGSIQGFLLARLKRTPGYLGGVLVGEISDLYVSDEMRGMGAGKDLVATAFNELTKHDVHSIEVQVMIQNTNGLEFWKSMGFREDVLLVRRMINSRE